MSEVIERDSKVEDKLLALVFSFFAPIFFLYAGTRIDLSSLSLDNMLIAVVLFITAVSLKYIGTYLPAKYFIPKDAKFGGLLFNYRLTFGIIAASVGLETGLISTDIFAVILLVVVTSAMLPGFILRNNK